MTMQQIASQPTIRASEILGVKVRANCRSCDSRTLTRVLVLGNLYVSNFVDSTEAALYPRVPLELVLCLHCSLLQLSHTTPPEWLYRDYSNKSADDAGASAALADIAAKTCEFVGLSCGDAVLDIGCNDGTLLRSFSVPGIRRIGFEPAINLNREAAQGTDRIVSEFFTRGPVAGERFRIVTCVNTMESLDDPNQLIADVASVLTADGVWLIEMRYLPLLLARNGIDAVRHEHLAYYSLTSLEPLLARHGLVVADAETNDFRGGSLRVYVVHEGFPARVPGRRDRVRLMRGREAAGGLELPPTYEKFGERILSIGNRLNDWLRCEHANKKIICGHGGSASAHTLLQVFGLDHSLIDSMTEVNSEFWGKYTVGTWIPIVPAAQARPYADDFLVLPWYLFKEIQVREAGFLKRGGKLIAPLPQPQVSDSQGTQLIPGK